MRLLRRHIFRSLAGPFLFSLGALTGLLMMNTLAKRFGDLVGKDLPWQVIAEVLALSIPFIIALTLPMAVLVAVLYGYSQLGADNEITAMRANGVSVAQMLRPALLAGIALTLINFIFVDQILPRTNARLRNLQSDIGHKKPAFQMREQAINELQPYYIWASRVFPGSGRLRDVQIYDLGISDGRRVIYADSGIMAFNEKQTDLIFRLFDGRVNEFKTVEPGRIQVTRFTQNTVRVRDVQNFLHRNLENFERGDREMTTCEMMDRVTASERTAVRAAATRRRLVDTDLRALMGLMHSGLPVVKRDSAVAPHCGLYRKLERAIGRMILPEVAEAQVPVQRPPPPPPPAVQAKAAAPVVVDTATHAGVPAPGAIVSSLTEVVTARQEAISAERAADAFRVEIHKKYTISVACFTFVLIGVPLALRFPRGGMGLVIGGGLTIFAIFYVSLTAGESLADRDLVSPALAMWFPNAVVFVAGIFGLFKVRREFGSTRGGDLAELIESVKGFFRLRRRARA
jgi:lipopolysaccharide export system permease protein